MVCSSHITVSGATHCVISLSLLSVSRVSLARMQRKSPLRSPMLFSGSLFSARDKKERFTLVPRMLFSSITGCFWVAKRSSRFIWSQVTHQTQHPYMCSSAHTMLCIWQGNLLMVASFRQWMMWVEVIFFFPQLEAHTHMLLEVLQRINSKINRNKRQMHDCTYTKKFHIYGFCLKKRKHTNVTILFWIFLVMAHPKRNHTNTNTKKLNLTCIMHNYTQLHVRPVCSWLGQVCVNRSCFDISLAQFYTI